MECELLGNVHTHYPRTLRSTNCTNIADTNNRTAISTLADCSDAVIALNVRTTQTALMQSSMIVQNVNGI